MKIYEGKRTMDGLVVTVDGAPLPAHYEVKQFTKRGFEWTYEGASPRQLALAILFDYTADRQRAVALSEPFMKDVVANLDNSFVALYSAASGWRSLARRSSGSLRSCIPRYGISRPLSPRTAHSRRRLSPSPSSSCGRTTVQAR